MCLLQKRHLATEYTENFEKNLLKPLFSLWSLWQKRLLQEVYYIFSFAIWLKY